MNELYQNLWAPWRLSYIKGDDEKCNDGASPKPATEHACFLCEYIAQDNDAENFVVDRSEFSMTVLNRYPYNNGHLLVAPQRHVGAFDELTTDELLDCQLVMQRMVSALKNTVSPDGFNIGLNLGDVAGAGLPGHLHWHIVPRWAGDKNFLAVTGNTNVIPQSLEALYTLLIRELETPHTSPGKTSHD